MQYHKLSTTKYLNEKVEQEAKALRRHRNRQAIQSFVNFLLCTAIIFATFVAYQTMPQWMPEVIAFSEDMQLVERFTSGLAKVQAWLGLESYVNPL